MGLAESDLPKKKQTLRRVRATPGNVSGIENETLVVIIYPDNPQAGRVSECTAGIPLVDG